MVTKVGLTGGIGSGKTTVAKLLIKLGYSVYFADQEAKILMNTDKDIIRNIKHLLGEASYDKGKLNKVYVAKRVFGNKDLLGQLNHIVHPAVGRHFNQWCLLNRDKKIVFQEAAILFENGSNDKFDKMILVTAPQNLRLARVMKRDKQKADAVIARMNNQWSDERKTELADFVIRCDGKHLLIPRVLDVLGRLQACV